MIRRPRSAETTMAPPPPRPPRGAAPNRQSQTAPSWRLESPSRRAELPAEIADSLVRVLRQNGYVISAVSGQVITASLDIEPETTASDLDSRLFVYS